MEKPRQPYDKEFMRMAILKHEETFKEQVYELHRLYQIQKILMKSSIRPKGQKQEGWNFSHFNPQSKLDLEQPAGEEYIADLDGDDEMLEIIEESAIELTLGPTRYGNNNNRSNRRKRSEAPLTSDYSGPSFSSSSTGSSHVNRTGSFKTHQRKHGQVPSGTSDIGAIQRQHGHFPDMTSGFYRNGSKSTSSNIDAVDERLKLPPWLFQVLSLDMT